jgi:hypothetical protein
MNLDSLIAKLAKSYEQPSPEVSAEVVQQIAASGKKPEMRKLRDTTPSKLAPSKPGISLHVRTEPKGSLDSRSFALAMQNAGKRRDDEGNLYCDKREVRDDKIRAIAAYVGFVPLPARLYDENGKTPIQTERSFAEQEMLASMQAHRELNPRPIGATPPRRIPLHVKGYVAGMPNDMRRKVLDLKGREQLAADAEAEHVKLASEATHEQIREEHEALALLEKERREQIQADLRALGAL